MGKGDICSRLDSVDKKLSQVLVEQKISNSRIKKAELDIALLRQKDELDDVYAVKRKEEKSKLFARQDKFKYFVLGIIGAVGLFLMEMFIKLLSHKLGW